MSFLSDFTIDFMKLITWNIQGLGSIKCMLERKNLHQELKSLCFKGVPDILLLQEQHMSANMILSICESERIKARCMGFVDAPNGGERCVACNKKAPKFAKLFKSRL